MGTCSMTIILEENQELVRFYRQYDGYPEGHGVDLARRCNVQIVNGLSLGADGKPVKGVANGMGCLAAQVIAGLKDGPGNVYMEPPGEISDWVEFVYIVRGPGRDGKIGKATIECSTQTGPFPFNIQKESHQPPRLDSALERDWSVTTRCPLRHFSVRSTLQR